mgnify:CR=1 FL=1
MAQTLNKFMIEKPPDADLSKLPERLRQKLLPFQREGLNFAVSKNGRSVVLTAVKCLIRSDTPIRQRS